MEHNFLKLMQLMHEVSDAYRREVRFPLSSATAAFTVETLDCCLTALKELEEIIESQIESKME